jgi:hypothetical protein
MSSTGRSRKVPKSPHMLKRSPVQSSLKIRVDSLFSSSKRIILLRRIKNNLAQRRFASPSAKGSHSLSTNDTNSFLKVANSKLVFAINNSFAESTSAGHNYAIQRFLRFAANCGFSEEEALPCNAKLLCLWIADGIGKTGVGTATSNIAALSAWHRNRGLPFVIPPQVKTLKRALKLHWPEEKQQKPPRPPISPAMIRLLADSWCDGSPREKCALAIAMAAFIGQMRLGELLPACATNFAREKLPSRGNWSLRAESKGSSSIFLPWTKTTGKAGAVVTLPVQANPLDPTRAICHHLISSKLMDSALLCEYTKGRKVEILDKEHFMAMCNCIWSSHGFQKITGHSFRIGGTTSLLLAGVDAEIVKGMGRWSSDAFKLYWRKVETLFAKHASEISWVDFDI